MKKSFTFLINSTILLFSISQVHSQTTGLSGTGSNANGAGTAGTDNTNIGTTAGASITAGGVQNTNVGKNSGNAIVTADNNTCVGFEAGKVNTASENTFLGSGSGGANTSGVNNTFTGYQAGRTNSTHSRNTFNGYQAGYSNGGSYFAGGGGNDHTFIGYQAGYNSGSSDSEGISTKNTFVGSQAGYSNTTGGRNTYMGYRAGYSNTSGYRNTCIGDQAGTANTTGQNNTFVGQACAYYNTTGSSNTYVGYAAGTYNSTGSYNTMVGELAGNGATGNNYSFNSLFGYKAGYALTTASNNTFVGYQSGVSTTSGNCNCAFGLGSLQDNITAIYNTAIGYQALSNTTGDDNTALGLNAGFNNTTGTNNTFIGYNADANAGTYSNCAAIGNGAVVTASNKIFVGNTAITHIEGAVNFTISDGRFKINVTENVKGLEFINKLRPVTYLMNTAALDDFLIQNMPDDMKVLHKKGMDFGPSMAMVHAGFIAQEVEQAAKQTGFVSSIVSTPSNSMDPYALSYSEFVVPLVKAVQELSKNTDNLTAKVEQLQSANTAMKNEIDQLNSIINSQKPKPGIGNTVTQNINSTDVTLNNIQSVILDQNIPNPFAEQTSITYFLSDNTGKAQILFYNSDGKLIQSSELKGKGKGILNVFANDLTTGVYLYSIIIDGKVIETKKMMKQ